MCVTTLKRVRCPILVYGTRLLCSLLSTLLLRVTVLQITSTFHEHDNLSQWTISKRKNLCGETNLMYGH